MIPISNHLVNEQAGVLSTANFGAKSQNLSKIFHILRSQLYSDKLRAIVREYSTNALDAHISAGKSAIPIQVTLPTALDSFLKIRDFGAGLTDEQILEVYTSYGESTKTADQNQNGMLGIGCKAGFCYSDSFIVNSYKDGSLTVWNCYIEPNDESKMAQMGKSETTEPNGVEVIIPIKGADIDKLRETALDIYAYFEMMPEITNITEQEKISLDSVRNVSSVFEGIDWKFIGGGARSFVVMANVAYPIEDTIFNDTEVRDEVKLILRGGIILKIKNGEIEFSASRESLQYTPHTKKKLAFILNNVIDDLIKQGTDKFNGCTTLWDAKQLWKEVFDYHGKLYSVRHLFARTLVWKGFPLNTDKFATNNTKHTNITNTCYTSGNWKISRQEVVEIKASGRTLVVENDTAICNGIINRVVGPIKNNQYDAIHILKFPDFATRSEWFQISGYDGPLVSLSSLPKEPVAKYYPNTKTGGYAGPRNANHYCKEFIFTDPSSVRCTPSEFWTPVDIEIEEDAGVYVELERFYIVNEGVNRDTIKPSELQHKVNLLKNIGIQPPSVIYGFKKSSINLAKSNPNMVSLWDWIRENTSNYFASFPEIHQEFANKQEYDKIKESFSCLGDYAKKIEKLSLDKNNPLLKLFCEKLAKLRSFNATKLVNVIKLIPNIEQSISLPPNVNIREDINKINKLYPLLILILQKVEEYYLDDGEDWGKAISDYIVLMDAVTPDTTGILPEAAPVSGGSDIVIASPFPPEVPF